MTCCWFYRLLPVAMLLGWVSGGAAFQNPDKEPLPTVDRRIEAHRKLIAASTNDAALALSRAPEVPGLRITRDELLETPKFVIAENGFLTGRSGQVPGAKVDGKIRAALAPLAVNDPHVPVKQFLARNAGWLKHGSEVLDQGRLEREYVTDHNGLRTVVWQQQVEGLDVFGGHLIAHVTKHGELVSLSSRMLPQAEKKRFPLARQKSLAQSPEISAARALLAAAQDVRETIAPEKSVMASDSLPRGKESRQLLQAPFVLGDAAARLVWLPMNANDLRLAWEVIFYAKSSGHLFRSVVDAETGEVWVRHSLTKFAEPATYRVFTRNSPLPMWPGWSGPSTAEPAMVPRELVTLTALNTNASPNGWIDTDVFETRGNNVQAHTDRNGDNQPDLPRPSATNRVFDFPLDLTLNPTNYRAAAVVNMFYWCNFAHDRLYELGFTEMVGNFQTTNFNRGGVGNDAVVADAQDGEGFNNANFSTPPQDGLAPRMQMYIFNGPNPDRDAAYDAEVILHEYCHGLSDRLVGAGYGIYDSQSAGMAEGWSDYMAMCLLSRPEQDPGGNFPFSAYVSRLFGSVLTENYYYGLRRYPYSTNMAVSPLTLKDIDPTKASFHIGIPRNPAIGGSASQVHNQGEVWCGMLWGMRERLIRKHGFEVGNRLAMQLVVDGMRGCPSNPTFINARDAILLADRVNNQNANRAEIWAAFARRGMGALASVPPSYTTVGVIEDFSQPEDFEVTPSAQVTVNGVVAGPFDPASVTFELYNAGQQPIQWRATGDALLKLSATAGTLAPETTSNIVATLASVATELPVGSYTQTVSFLNLGTGSNQVRTVRLVIREQQSFLVELFDSVDFDLEYSTLTFTPDNSLAGYQVCVQPATNFLTDPAGGQPIVLGDDWYVPLTITNGGSVDICGARSNIFYISSNGQLAMRMGNTQYFQPELHIFYEQVRAAALYADLHPAQSNILTGQLDAKVSWRQLEDRAAVTWLDVPEYGINNSNSFQIELFFNGAIRMTWLRVDAKTAKVGLSTGRGIPSELVENDFSASTRCGRQLAIQVANGVEGQGTVTNAGRVNITQPISTDLTVTLISESLSEIVLPPTVIIPAGQTSAWFSVTYPDDSLLDGPRRTRVHVDAPDFSPAQLLVTVMDNETAQISLHFPVPVTEGAGVVANVGEVRVQPPPDDAVLIKLSASGLAQVLNPPYVILGAGQSSASFGLNILDNQSIEGVSVAEVRAEVLGWPAGRGLLSVRDNESLALALQLPAFAGETFGVMTNAGRVAVVGPLTFDLVVLLESAQPTRVGVPPTVIIPAGQSSVAFNVRIYDDAAVNAANQVTVTASALGFVSVSTSVTLGDDEALPAPQLISPLRGATNVPLTPRLTWYSGFGELLVNGGFETGDFTGWSNVVSADGSSFIINAGALRTAQGNGPFAPLSGAREALSHPVNAGRRELSQVVMLPVLPGAVALSWRQQIRNFAEGFTPRHQFRVELRAVEDDALLATLFATQPETPLRPPAEFRTADLSVWKGRLVRLAFVVEDSLGALNVSLDDVSVRFDPATVMQYAVYVGVTSNLGPDQLVGVVTNNYLELSTPLEFLTRYHWQVVARRGAERAASEIRSFITTGPTPLPSVAINSLTNYMTVELPATLTLASSVVSPSGVTKVSYYDGEDKIGEATAPPYTVNYSLPAGGLRLLHAEMLDGVGWTTASPDVNVIALPAGDQPLTFISSGAPWRYLDDGTDLGGAWRQADFDDARWKTGQGRFGYGVGGETTILDFGTDPANKHITTYFRTAFTNEADLNSVVLRLVCDDGVVAWLNEVPLRVNMPALSVISYNDRAVEEVVGAAQTNFVTYNIHPWVLPQGPVVMAVELHQHTNNGPDLAFDLVLEGSGNYRPVVSLGAPATGALIPMGQPVVISAQAFDRYGRLAVVEYFVDDQKIGETRAEPHSLIWSNAVAGSHKITVRAVDNRDAATVSTAAWIAVGQPSLVGPIIETGGFRLAWPVGDGSYWLEAATRLDHPDWQAVTNVVTGGNGLSQVVLPFDAPQRFFRLRWNK